MDKISAIQKLQEFKEQSGLGRDTLIDVYNNFRVSPCLDSVSVVYRGEIVKILHEEFWDYVNTSDIREICTTGFVKTSKDEEFENMVTKLRKEKLNTADKLRFERNITNKSLRTINQIEEFEQEIIKGLDKLKPIKHNKSSVIDLCNSDDVLLVQLSDLHINEITNEFREVGYSIDTANKRLKKFAQKIKKEIISNGIKKVVIAMTGDLCNSDSILSKQQNNVTNKATSILIATHLLQHFILDIYDICENIVISGVAGNEGRLSNTDNFYMDENLISNSPDFIILNFLRMLFKDIMNIKFLNGRSAEQIININNNNILLCHGNNFGKGDVGKAVFQAFSRYADKGVNIRFAIFGHLHATKISNFFMRSSSLVGNNAYSTLLNVNSRASQNICYINKNGDICPMAIDLQNIDDIIGYDISDELNKLNIKDIDTRKDLDEIQVV